MVAYEVAPGKRPRRRGDQPVGGEEVDAFVIEERHEARDLFGRVRQIGIERDDEVAARRTKARPQRASISTLRFVDDACPGLLRQASGFVGRRVVYDDDLRGVTQFGQSLGWD